MILDAIFDGQIYPSETVVPKCKAFWEANEAATTIMSYFEQKLSKEDYEKLERLNDRLADPTISYRKQSDRYFLVKSLSLFILTTFKEENTMKMNLNEMEALYAFGCPNRKATIERLRLVAAIAPDPAAKKLFYMLSIKLSAEGADRWYRCFYHNLRVRMDEYYHDKAVMERVLNDRREDCYGEADEV